MQLAGSPGYLIRRAQQVHATIWSTVFGGDLTGPQYAVLLAVANGESMDQALIGARASLDSSTVADIVARLADTGMASPARGIRSTADGCWSGSRNRRLRQCRRAGPVRTARPGRAAWTACRPTPCGNSSTLAAARGAGE